MELGLFPLGIVLLPTEQVPLHVFEPRYKELISECLDDDREFGLVLSDDDGLRQIGTRARVTEILERFEDGRMNVVVQGGERFRLLGLTSGRSFDTGEVEPVEDEEGDPPPTEDEVERAVDRFRKLAAAAEAEVDEPDPASPWLSFELAARVEFGVERRQELLELRSEPERLRFLAQLFEQATQAIAREREVKERAARNGRVHTD